MRDVRCKHPLRPGANFCQVCGTASALIPNVTDQVKKLQLNSVATGAFPASNRDLQQIRAQADAICLDAELWNLQKQFVQHINAPPDARGHLSAIICAVCSGAVSVALFRLGHVARIGWVSGAALFAAAASALFFFQFISARRAFKLIHAAWMSEYKRLKADLFNPRNEPKKNAPQRETP